MSQPAMRYGIEYATAQAPELRFGTLILITHGHRLGVIVGYEPMHWDRGERPYRVVVATSSMPQPGSRKYVRVRKFARREFTFQEEDA